MISLCVDERETFYPDPKSLILPGEEKRRQKLQEKEDKTSVYNVIAENVTISNTAESSTNDDNKKGINWNLITTIVAVLSVIATLLANDSIRNDVFKYWQRNKTPSVNPSSSKSKP